MLLYRNTENMSVGDIKYFYNTTTSATSDGVDQLVTSSSPLQVAVPDSNGGINAAVAAASSSSAVPANDNSLIFDHSTTIDIREVANITKDKTLISSFEKILFKEKDGTPVAAINSCQRCRKLKKKCTKHKPKCLNCFKTNFECVYVEKNKNGRVSTSTSGNKYLNHLAPTGGIILNDQNINEHLNNHHHSPSPMRSGLAHYSNSSARQSFNAGNLRFPTLGSNGRPISTPLQQAQQHQSQFQITSSPLAPRPELGGSAGAPQGSFYAQSSPVAKPIISPPVLGSNGNINIPPPQQQQQQIAPPLQPQQQFQHQVPRYPAQQTQAQPPQHAQFNRGSGGVLQPVYRYPYGEIISNAFPPSYVVFQEKTKQSILKDFPPGEASIELDGNGNTPNLNNNIENSNNNSQASSAVDMNANGNGNLFAANSGNVNFNGDSNGNEGANNNEVGFATPQVPQLQLQFPGTAAGRSPIHPEVIDPALQ